MSEMVFQDPEQLLCEVLRKNKGAQPVPIDQMIRLLRAKCGIFTDTEALLHMLDALMKEKVEGKGW
jgi:hypothetical protein